MEKEINSRIKHHRNLKKMTQEELGKRLGMKCSTYSQMERRGKITVEMAQAIAEILDVDPDIIMYGEKATPIDFTPFENPPVVFEDPNKNNPFGKPSKPEITVSYTSGDFPLSVMETLIITQFRDLEAKDRQEVIDLIARKLGRKK